MDERQRMALTDTIRQLRKAIDDGTLEGEARLRAEKTIEMASGLLLSSWLPKGWGRKAIMLILFFVGCYGLFWGQPLYLICWSIAVVFSPKIVGEAAMFIGSIPPK